MQIELNLGHLPDSVRERAEEALDDLMTECMIEGKEPDTDEIFELINEIVGEDP